MKRILSLSIVLLLIFTSSLNAAPNQPKDMKRDGEAAAVLLKHLGLFKGVSEDDFALYKKPTRLEGLVMLIRLLGEENAALSSQTANMPFDDVPNWGLKYVAYAYKKGYTKGVSATKFDPSAPMPTKAYLTFVLRALGYSDTNGDFTYDEPFQLANKKRLLVGVKNFFEANNNLFLREDVAIISENALYSSIKNSDITLIETLFNKKAISMFGLCSVGDKVSNIKPLKDYKIVKVTNVTELFGAVGNDTIVLLESGTYDVTEYAKVFNEGTAENYDKINTDFVSFDSVFDGIEASLYDLTDFHIVGMGANATTEIICRPRYANVLTFHDCYDCTISNVTMGHTPEDGYCTGAVLKLEGSNNFAINNSILYGCGTYGVESLNSNNILIYNNEIDDCSYNALAFTNSNNIDILRCYIHDNASFSADLNGSKLPASISRCKKIREIGNYFENNHYPTDF